MFGRGHHGKRWRQGPRSPHPHPGRAGFDPAAPVGEDCFPLSQAEIGAPLEVVEILNARGVAQRLRPMGLAPGDPIRVVRGAPFWGPIIVEVPGRVLALGRGVARHVLVRLAPLAAKHTEPRADDAPAGPTSGDR